MKAKFRLTTAKEVLIFNELTKEFQPIGITFFMKLLHETIAKEINIEFENSEDDTDYSFYVNLIDTGIKLSHETFNIDHFTRNINTLEIFKNEITEFLSRVREWYNINKSEEYEIEF